MPIFGQKCQFWAKFGRVCAKNPFLWRSRFLSTGHITSMPGDKTFPFGPTRKNIYFRAMGHFLGSPLFLALLGLCQIISISTLNFGPFSTKLGRTVWAIKKMTQNDNGTGPGRNYRKTAVFMFSQKVFCWQKRVLSPQKNTQNFLRD